MPLRITKYITRAQGFKIRSTHRIIVDVLWESLYWFIGLLEVIAVLAAILAAGLGIATAAFWLVSHALAKFHHPPPEPDPSEWELDCDVPPSLDTNDLAKGSY